MIKKLFFVFLVSLNVFAADLQWSDLSEGKSYYLNEKLKLSNRLNLRSGTELTLQQIDVLEMINVVSFEFTLKLCPASRRDLRTEMIIHKELYGINLDPGCKLSVMVEVKDLFKRSLIDDFRRSYVIQ